MINTLYLPSTPLNVLLSVAHAAAHQSQQQASLLLIDQKNCFENPYVGCLRELSFFDHVDCLPGILRGYRKLAERRQNFSYLTRFLDEFTPQRVVVGSDRRVEFQFVMQLLTQKGIDVEGIYLDDGLYSYAGKTYSWLKEPMNAFLKKIAYGSWWHEPKTVGASQWIDSCWVFRPDEVIDTLKSKSLYKIESEWFNLADVKSFGMAVCDAFGLDENALLVLQDMDLLILIPHPENIKKMRGYEVRLLRFLDSLKALQKKIAAKYHPRTESHDLLRLVEAYQVSLIPQGLAFEFVLPFLKKGSVIVGDVGTALLTAQWLRPDLKVFAVLAKGDVFQSRFNKIYHQLGIHITNDFDKVTHKIEGEICCLAKN